MIRLPIFKISLIILCAFGCGRHQSVQLGSKEQYRDSIIGKFNGNNIDTLIAEPIETTIDRSLWNWRIYGKNNTVDTLILSQRFTVRLIQEGDLDGNGTDEFGVRREADAGTWDNYCVYTFDKDEWKYLIKPIWTYSDHFYIDMNKGADVVERAKQSGYVTVRFSDIRNDEFCIVDTLIPIAPYSILLSSNHNGNLYKGGR